MQLETFDSGVVSPATQINLFPFQGEVVMSKAQHRVQVSGRRTGKSYTDIAASFTHSQQVNRARVLFVGPTIGQAMEAFWPTLLDMTRDSGLLARPPRENPSPDLFFGPQLRNARFTLKSADKPETLRGISPTPTLVVLDELALYDPGFFEDVLDPMTLDPIRQPRFLVSSTPKGTANLLYRMYLWGQSDQHDDWASWQFRAIDVRPDMKQQIEKLRARMDPRMFDQEVNATFLSTAGGVFTSFDKNVNVRDDLPDFREGEAAHVCIDFNVNIMASCAIAARQRGDVEYYHILNEWSGAADTDALAKQIKQDLPGRRIIVYPDPSGKAKKTSSPTGTTDHSILREHGFEVRTRSRTPPIKDSVNAVNRLLKDAAGNSRLFVAESCEKTIVSLENTEWRTNATGMDADTATIDKRQGVEHASDAIRYWAELTNPVWFSGVRVHDVDWW